MDVGRGVTEAPGGNEREGLYSRYWCTTDQLLLKGNGTSRHHLTRGAYTSCLDELPMRIVGMYLRVLCTTEVTLGAV